MFWRMLTEINIQALLVDKEPAEKHRYRHVRLKSFI